ncbi:MAG: DNA polymerase III subunit gamma/tau [Gammaproteobacteria bacterium]
MSYQVLARKWRPKSFAEMVGQQPILQILQNALSQKRIHHAYLFSGTRGVGKTTLGRIITKCLNCETGITATPCNTCNTCKAIDAGNFVDLIEIDAASRTKVEDTRELLNNVQYAPTTGRYKVYLIDEVHMLSGHSFNALLKTLEEPPEHVKFLLATTDPQKLPITVLSRCLKLQLNLLTQEQISEHLQHILKQENVTFEDSALNHIAKAAAGSMRDALSLLDQAIAFGNGDIKTQDVITMLGITSDEFIWEMLSALGENDTEKMLATCKTLANRACNFNDACESLQTALYHINCQQVAPNTIPDSADGKKQFETFAKQFSPEQVQLYYQIVSLSKRDLPLAPTPELGFEMMCLRLAAFSPMSNDSPQNRQKKNLIEKKKPSSNDLTAANWHQVVEKIGLSGMTSIIAKNANVGKITDNEVELTVSGTHQSLCNDNQRGILTKAISDWLGRQIRVKFVESSEETQQETPIMRQQRERSQAQQRAEHSLTSDPHVQSLMRVFEGDIDTSSVALVDE